jgi:hypothetical protein
MPSATEIITKALKIAGVLGESETASSGQAADGLVSLNDLLDSWSTDETYIYTIQNETFPLVDGVNSYTIGVGGDFNTVRPVIIDSVVVNLNGVSYPVKQINSQDYADIAYKANNTGIPEFFYCDFAYPLATIYLYGAPSADLTISIGRTQQLTTFADLTTQYTFPPGYNRLLNYGLAMEISPEYGVKMSPEAQFIASEAKANVRNRNLPDPVMKTEVGHLTGIYGYSNRGGY